MGTFFESANFQHTAHGSSLGSIFQVTIMEGDVLASLSQAARPRVTMQQSLPREILVESMSGRPAPHRYRSTVPQRQDCMHDRVLIFHLLVTWTFLFKRVRPRPADL
jgi:hypothetical protein